MPAPGETTPDHGRDAWERRWSQALEAGAHVRRLPSAHLVAAAADLPPGRALDAGCGHGAETLWLAERGWEVTAVDFAETALAHARSEARRLGLDGRVDWVAADLGDWVPPAGRHDLVVSLFVHVAGPVPDMVARLAAGVAPGGTLVLAGHRPIDPATGERTRAAGQVQVSVPDALRVLEPPDWEIRVAEDRPRTDAHGGADAVVVARRRPRGTGESLG